MSFIIRPEARETAFLIDSTQAPKEGGMRVSASLIHRLYEIKGDGGDFSRRDTLRLKCPSKINQNRPEFQSHH